MHQMSKDEFLAVLRNSRPGLQLKEIMLADCKLAGNDLRALKLLDSELENIDFTECMMDNG